MFIDFTTELDIALFFACLTCDTNKKNEGLIAVAPTMRLSQKLMMLDISGHSMCERPRSQSAFVVSGEKYTDMKSSRSRKELDIQWYSFIITGEDHDCYCREKKYLTDIYTDLAARIVFLTLAKHTKKYEDELAKIIAYSSGLPMVPIIFDEANQSMQTLKEAGIPYKEHEIRQSLHYMLSEKYPHSLENGNAPILFKSPSQSKPT